jgi:hypothetical protein
VARLEDLTRGAAIRGILPDGLVTVVDVHRYGTSAIELTCIVEGHGECEAVPVLVRRIAAQLDLALRMRIPPPLRVPKSRLLKPGELERTVELAARKVGRPGVILILLDSDEDLSCRVESHDLEARRGCTW